MHTDEVMRVETDREMISELTLAVDTLVEMISELTSAVDTLVKEQAEIRTLLTEYKDAVIPAVEKLQDSPVFKMIAGK